MRRHFTLIVVGLAFVGVFDLLKGAWPTAADEPAGQPAPQAGRVALLDVAKVFSHHRVFQRLSDGLRREVEAAERELRARKAELQAQNDALAKLVTGSPEAKQLQSKIARESAELKVKVEEQKKEFFTEEAGIYLKIYQEVMKLVDTYSEKNGINLVMRFNGEPLDKNDPQAVQKELNKAVLYHKGIDITEAILAIVNDEPRA